MGSFSSGHWLIVLMALRNCAISARILVRRYVAPTMAYAITARSRIGDPLLTLSRFSLGRIGLHVIAMLGDREVRFHCSGILRELSCVAVATRLVAQIRSRLTDALAFYLAQPVKRHRAAAAADPQRLSTMLVHGDVLLTEGNTRMAALVKRITGSRWTHVSMYVGPLEQGPDPRCIVEADVAAGVRAVPLSELSGLHVRVLRPTRLRDTDRRRVVDWVVGRIGDGYDLAHAWILMKRLLRLPFASGAQPAESATRFICTSLVAQALVLVGYQIVPVQAAVHDAALADHRYVIPRDFESASGFDVVTKSAG